MEQSRSYAAFVRSRVRCAAPNLASLSNTAMHLKLTALAALVVGVAGHGSMISPAPRSAHGQKYDARNKCDCHKTGGCYSNITTGAQYCGVGCLGESCLYYQIGCYAGCGTCSMSGKGLYPSPEDLQLAGNCEPAKPSLPEHMRSYNVDNQSTAGDWTKVNPWRAPGSAGIGNPKFQPCGVNSGWDTPHPSRGSAGPPAGGQPIGAYGTDLPPVGAPAVWKSGGIEEVSYSIYANHGAPCPFPVPQPHCTHFTHLPTDVTRTNSRQKRQNRRRRLLVPPVQADSLRHAHRGVLPEDAARLRDRHHDDRVR